MNVTLYQFIIQIIVTNQAIGNALVVALGGPGDAETFSDENCMRLTKGGLPAWATEPVVKQREYDIACNFRDGINPPELGLSAEQFAAVRAVATIRCGGREIQYTLRQWAELHGYAIAEAG